MPKKGRLKPEDERKIQKNFRFLLHELEAKDITDVLFEEDVISAEDMAEVESAPNKTDRAKALVQKLLNAGPGEAYSRFIESLRDKYSHVVDRLEGQGCSRSTSLEDVDFDCEASISSQMANMQLRESKPRTQTKNSKLAGKLRDIFLAFVKPNQVLPYFHEYNSNVLTGDDIAYVTQITKERGDRDGSICLLERLSLYDGWTDCLLSVLRDEHVQLNNVAEWIGQLLYEPVKRDYKTETVNKLAPIIEAFVKPLKILEYFHQYSTSVLTDKDLKEIREATVSSGDKEGAKVLLDRLLLHDGWYQCLLAVLQDGRVGLHHVATWINQVMYDPIKVKPTSDLYNKKLLAKMEIMFLAFVKPSVFVNCIHKHNKNVLTQKDIDLVTKITKTKGDTEGARSLLHQLVKYEGWFPCLLSVLRDSDVNLPNVATWMTQIQMQVKAEGS